MYIGSIFSIALCSYLIALPNLSQAADNPRDFNGVWQAFASDPAAGRGTDSNNKLSAAGKLKVADFAAKYPHMIEPGSYCVPPGMPATMTSLVSYPIEITQIDNQLRMFAEMESQYRRVFLDGRDLPEGYPPSGMGYSIGHWEGNTLVVETQLLNEMLTGRFPRTENTSVVERIHKIKRAQVASSISSSASTDSTDAINDSVLVFDLTVTDSTLYNEPQKVTVYYQPIDDNSLLGYDCISDIWQQALDAANP